MVSKVIQFLKVFGKMISGGSKIHIVRYGMYDHCEGIVYGAVAIISALLSTLS